MSDDELYRTKLSDGTYLEPSVEIISYGNKWLYVAFWFSFGMLGCAIFLYVGLKYA